MMRLKLLNVLSIAMIVVPLVTIIVSYLSFYALSSTALFFGTGCEIVGGILFYVTGAKIEQHDREEWNRQWAILIKKGMV